MSDFDFRRFAPEHAQLMFEWLRRPHVAEWWDDPPSLDEIREKYLACDAVQRYIVYLNDKPIAFIQSYVAMGSGDGWWEDETDPGVVGIDQFIAEPDLVGKGIGTAMIRAFVDRLLTDPGVSKIQVDPRPDNARAIRCYEKVGFIGVREVPTPDGPAWYMILTR